LWGKQRILGNLVKAEGGEVDFLGGFIVAVVVRDTESVFVLVVINNIN
jgi:hypothetical protein